MTSPLLLQLVVIIATARLCGLALRFIGQPPVIGEMAAWIILGPMVFGALAPAFHGQLFEDRHGDVVVAAPVGGPFGVGELVHVVAAGLGRQTFGLGVHRRGCVHEVASPAVALDE